MTPGADGETADGMSLAGIGRIIGALRHERYRFQPVKRVYIPKRTGSQGRWACRRGRIKSWAK
jgi:retron-type reverse transcriptase